MAGLQRPRVAVARASARRMQTGATDTDAGGADLPVRMETDTPDRRRPPWDLRREPTIHPLQDVGAHAALPDHGNDGETWLHLGLVRSGMSGGGAEHEQ